MNLFWFIYRFAKHTSKPEVKSKNTVNKTKENDVDDSEKKGIAVNPPLIISQEKIEKATPGTVSTIF
jgi:Na+-transporting methylmalonyl-CoA/oxaloacetate decarboxylase gamma subunit